MKNNLTEKDIENLNKWAEAYDIDELKIKDKEKIFNLEELHIISVSLTELPKEIGNLTNLKSLYIDCYSNELPKEIFNLINLEELHIISVSLTELPKEIGNLTNLKRLDIRTNNFTKLPKEIGNLINLEKLSIDCNNLEISPDGIEKLINLEKLNIDINIINENFNFKSFPIEEIGKLNNLKDLSIRIRKWEK